MAHAGLYASVQKGAALAPSHATVSCLEASNRGEFFDDDVAAIYRFKRENVAVEQRNTNQTWPTRFQHLDSLQQAVPENVGKIEMHKNQAAVRQPPPSGTG